MEVAVNWDDIRVFRTVVQCGNFSKAAEELGISQPTVGRRIKILQEELGLALFERAEDGLTLTHDGGVLSQYADEMAEKGQFFEIAARGLQHARFTVRIACSPLMAMALCHTLPNLLKDIDVTFLSSTDFVSLEKGEADIAIRNQLPDSGNLVARSLGVDSFGVYCSADFAERYQTQIQKMNLSQCPWVGFSQSMARLPSRRWLATNYPMVTPVVQVDHSLLILSAVRHGHGLGVLPQFIAVQEGLVSVQEPLDDLIFKSWLVTHVSMAKNETIIRVKDKIIDCIHGLRANGQ